MSERQANKTLVVTFDEVADIASVKALHQHLGEALACGQPVEFRAARCERMDTAVLQTLYAFMREARERGLEVSWQGASLTVVDAARRLGMERALGLEGSH